LEWYVVPVTRALDTWSLVLPGMQEESAARLMPCSLLRPGDGRELMSVGLAASLVPGDVSGSSGVAKG
jgi:hypothetical protein